MLAAGKICRGLLPLKRADSRKAMNDTENGALRHDALQLRKLDEEERHQEAGHEKPVADLVPMLG